MSLYGPHFTTRKRWMPYDPVGWTGGTADNYSRRKRRHVVVPGYTRSSGFFGRFKGSEREMKFHDIDINDAVVQAGGNIAEDSCNVIAQGVTESQRVGRMCHVKKIMWRWELVLPTTAVAADTCDVVRIVLYWDRQTNGAAAGVTDILETDDFQSFNNLAHRKRFKILYDKTIAMNCESGSGRGTTDTLSYGCRIRTGSFYKKCHIDIEFDSTTGAITEQVSNNIGVLLVSSAGKTGFNSKMRLRFTD